MTPSSNRRRAEPGNKLRNKANPQEKIELHNWDLHHIGAIHCYTETRKSRIILDLPLGTGSTLERVRDDTHEYCNYH